MHRLTAGWMLVLALAVAPASAQRTAVSADLSPEMAAQVFRETVSDICIPSTAGSGMSALGAARDGRVQPTQDAETRRQIGAQAGETVWDVASARGVVTVREGQGRCIVSVYGPPVGATISGAMQALTGSGFDALVGTGGARQTLLGTSGGKRISVQLSGMEPGAPGHQSRFSVVTATVTAVQ